MHLVVVKSKHENLLDVYMMLVSNIKYTVCIYETIHFLLHAII